MHVDEISGGRFLVGLVIVVLALVVIGPRILRGVRAGSDPKLAGPVVAYMCVISAMVDSAIGTGHITAIAGATSFYVSDRSDGGRVVKEGVSTFRARCSPDPLKKKR